MKIKMFSQGATKDFWQGWIFQPELLEPKINEWLAAHPQAQIKEVRHDAFRSLWRPPLLTVSLYYTE